MNSISHNPILEISPATATNDILLPVNNLTSCIALLVIGEDNSIDCNLVLQMLPVPCAGIAFVSHTRLRFNISLAASMGLSRHYGCPCKVFSYSERARQWLTHRVSVSTQNILLK